MKTVIYILGWIGTFLFVWAYYLVSSSKLEATGRTYQWMNLAGAVCLGVNVFYLRAWPALGLEIIWSSIAIVALIRGPKKTSRSENPGERV